MKKHIILAAALLMTAASVYSCSDKKTSSESSSAVTTTAPETTEEITTETTTAAETEPTTEQVTAPQQEVGYEGMEAVYADEVTEGEYDITVDSSSSMFKITECKLTVSGGSMTAKMTMSGSGYEYLFMGTGEEAAKADESEYIREEEADGVISFTVPVEALDKEIDCAAFSKRKEQWYDRKLVFRADSLPQGACLVNNYTPTSALHLEPGEYTCEVTLEGGSGKASVESPALITVVDALSANARIVWSSDKYDKMVMEGATYIPDIVDGHSVFTIDIMGFDYKMPVGAETTAMSQPHMIDYTLYFDSSTIKKCE